MPGHALLPAIPPRRRPSPGCSSAPRSSCRAAGAEPQTNRTSPPAQPLRRVRARAAAALDVGQDVLCVSPWETLLGPHGDCFEESRRARSSPTVSRSSEKPARGAWGSCSGLGIGQAGGRSPSSSSATRATRRASKARSRIDRGRSTWWPVRPRPARWARGDRRRVVVLHRSVPPARSPRVERCAGAEGTLGRLSAPGGPW